MSQRLKRWESPRRSGRNDKGKGGSARARQLKKQTQMLRQRLKKSDRQQNNQQEGEKLILPPNFFLIFPSLSGNPHLELAATLNTRS